MLVHKSWFFILKHAKLWWKFSQVSKLFCSQPSKTYFKKMSPNLYHTSSRYKYLLNMTLHCRYVDSPINLNENGFLKSSNSFDFVPQNDSIVSIVKILEIIHLFLIQKTWNEKSFDSWYFNHQGAITDVGVAKSSYPGSVHGSFPIPPLPSTLGTTWINPSSHPTHPGLHREESWRCQG